MTNLLTQKTGHIGEIILNSPDSFNLIEESTFEEIDAILSEYEKDNEVKVVLLRANCGVSKKTGQKIFSAGVNLKKYDKKFKLLAENQQVFIKKLSKDKQLINKIQQSSLIILIGINGLVTGGFFELALACDMILASPSAVFSLNETNIGLIPGYGGIHLLSRLVGKNRAFELISIGRKIPVDEAYNLGIVSKVFNDQTFETNTLEYCKELCQKPSLHLIKSVLNGNISETEGFIKAASSPDARQMMDKFLDRS